MNTSLIDQIEDPEFLASCALASSWSDLLRRLGYAGSPKPRVYAAARQRAAILGVDVSALNERGTGPTVPWSEAALVEAVSRATTISSVATALGSNVKTVRAAIEKWQVDAAHLSGVEERRMSPALCTPDRDVSRLRVAAESMAGAWYTLHGAEVFAPLNGASECDLVAMLDGVAVQVQVKSTTYLRLGRYFVGVGSAGRSTAWERRPFDASKADELFVVCGDGSMYRIPSAQAHGKSNIHLTSGYDRYLVTLL